MKKLKKSIFYKDIILKYFEEVEKGNECKHQKKLVVFLKKIFDEDELYINDEQAQAYFKNEKLFPYDLFLWEKFAFLMHNCLYTTDGEPRFSDLFLYMGRGAGKNGYLSFEDFCLLTPANNIMHYDIDICSNTEEQSRTSFDDIYNILDSNEKFFKKYFVWTKTYIKNRKTGSTLRYRTNNPKSKDGLRSGKVDFDEVHQYENMENIKVFTTGLGKKKHPKKTFITTNGNVRDGVLDAYLLKSRNILDFEIIDNGFLPMLWEIDEKEDVYNPENWHKANPSLKYRKDLLTEIKKEFEDFKLDEISNSSFLNKRMNYPETLRDCEVASWQNIEKTNREVVNLDGRKCFVGIDSSSSTDFFSVVLLFKVGDVYYTKQHSWFCWESKDRSRIKIPLEEFEKKGLLTIVYQKQIPPSLAFEWLNKERIKHGYIYAKYVIDYYRFSFISNELYKNGIDKSMIKLDRPSDIMFVQPKIDSLFKGHKLIWGDDALMRWFTNNAKLIPCENNNFKYGKIEPKSRKTDGFFALVASFTAEKEEQLDTNTVFLRPFAL